MNKHASHVEEVAEGLSEKAGKLMKSADAVVQKSPYKALAIALGVGAVVGLYLGCRGDAKKAE